MIIRRLATLPMLGALIVGHATAAEPRDVTIDTRDGARHALVVAAGDGPHPTVVVLHGALGTAAGTMRSSGFAEAARRHDFTAVFADGLHRRWNATRRDGEPDDVAFVTTLVARLVSDGVALPDRVYLAGISNGGMMSFTLACAAPSLFAGVGTMIASRPAGLASCEPLKPMPLVMIAGTADPMVPYRGGRIGLRRELGRVDGVDATLAWFADADGCSERVVETPLPRKDPSASTSTVRVDRQRCRPGTSVTLYRIDGGGHAIAGRPALLEGMLGASTQDVVGADAIVDAFAR